MRRLGLRLFTVTTSCLVLLQIANWLYAQEMFALKEVVVEGNRLVKTSEILRLLEAEKQNNLFELNLQKIKAQIEGHAFIKAVSVSRRLPDHLLIKITEKQPIALFNDGGLRLVDDKGELLPELVKPDLLDYPVIMNPEIKNGPGFMQVIEFLNYVKKQDFALCCQISEISYSEEFGIYFYLIEGNLPVIVGKESFTGKCEKLAPVLSLLRRDKALARVKSLDLRYEGRVVLRDLGSS